MGGGREGERRDVTRTLKLEIKNNLDAVRVLCKKRVTFVIIVFPMLLTLTSRIASRTPVNRRRVKYLASVFASSREIKFLSQKQKKEHPPPLEDFFRLTEKRSHRSLLNVLLTVKSGWRVIKREPMLRPLPPLPR